MNAASSPPSVSEPYRRLDAAWLKRMRHCGWQGWNLSAGGEEVMDRAILFWEEGHGGRRTLNLTLRLRREANRKVRDALSARPGVDIFRGSIPYPRKQIVAGEVYPLDRNGFVVPGTALDAQIDTCARVRYFPYEEGDGAPFSTQGCLTMALDKAQGRVDEVEAMLEFLSSALGIDTHLSRPADLEYLFLRKAAWSMHLEGPDLDALLAELEGMDSDARVGPLRTYLIHASEGAFPAQYDWRPRFCSGYNPWAGRVGRGEGGWPFWMRPDMEAALAGPLAHAWLGHDLAAHAPAIGDRIARIIRSTGSLLSSEERWMRLGTPSQSIHRAGGQMGTGTFVPLRVLRDPGDATLVFDRGLLRRLDHIALEPGAVLSPQALTQRIALERAAEVPECVVYFKRSVSLLDSLVRINLDHEADRRKVLDALGNVGVRKIRGVPVETVVALRPHHRRTEMPTPTSAGSRSA